MPDNYYALRSNPATTGGHFSLPALGFDQGSSSPGQWSLDPASVLLPQYIAPTVEPTIVEPAELSSEQQLEMFLTVARRSQETAVMENAFNQALRIQRAITAATLSSTMPTALKIKTCEIPLLRLFLEFGQRSPDWRARVVQMLSDNVETGCGHLTVNRAKQVLKELAKRAGAKVLATELLGTSSERRIAAVILLGWLKHEKAIEPLVCAYDLVTPKEQQLILSTLAHHYQAKLAYHLKWRYQSTVSLAGPLKALLEIA